MKICRSFKLALRFHRDGASGDQQLLQRDFRGVAAVGSEWREVKLRDRYVSALTVNRGDFAKSVIWGRPNRRHWDRSNRCHRLELIGRLCAASAAVILDAGYSAKTACGHQPFTAIIGPLYQSDIQQVRTSSNVGTAVGKISPWVGSPPFRR